MIDITPEALSKLGEILNTQAADQEMSVRLTVSLSDPDNLQLVFSKRTLRDLGVEDENRRCVLLVDRDLAPTLSGMVLDVTTSETGQENLAIWKAPVCA